MGGYQEKAFKSDQDATNQIRRAVRDANGSVTAAARALGVSFRTLSRYISRLGLRDEIRTLRSESGTARPARPLTSPKMQKDYSGLASALMSERKP
jgi:DNA invertase Pin-like site-specific DNA recombinase